MKPDSSTKTMQVCLLAARFSIDVAKVPPKQNASLQTGYLGCEMFPIDGSHGALHSIKVATLICITLEHHCASADGYRAPDGPSSVWVLNFRKAIAVNGWSRKRWRDQGDDIRTFVGDFVAALPQNSLGTRPVRTTIPGIAGEAGLWCTDEQ